MVGVRAQNALMSSRLTAASPPPLRERSDADPWLIPTAVDAVWKAQWDPAWTPGPVPGQGALNWGGFAGSPHPPEHGTWTTAPTDRDLKKRLRGTKTDTFSSSLRALRDQMKSFTVSMLHGLFSGAAGCRRLRV